LQLQGAKRRVPMPYLVVTIDTEIDSPEWKPEFPYSLKNIKAIPKLQDLFKKHGVRPTYLITYPVATNKESIDVLASARLEGAEIGAHLHPWTTPPFHSEKERYELSYPHLSDLEKEKLVNLTQAIRKTFGVRPISYRAGRYGVDDESFKILNELGYKVDSSVTPTMNWANDGGPDFSKIKNIQPYILEGILEVPISIAVKGMSFAGYSKLSPKIKAILRKIGLVKTVWLRPSIFTFEEMKWLSDLILGKGDVKASDHVLNMMFHSNELMAGTSPYIKTEKEEKDFWEKLDKILDYLINQKKLENKTLCELLF